MPNNSLDTGSIKITAYQMGKRPNALKYFVFLFIFKIT